MTRLRHAHNAGFTLVEIMIVVMIIGLICMIAIPSLVKARMNSQAAAIANDFRVFEGCFDHYAFVNFGSYPPTDLTPATYPVGMETNWLPETWVGPTPSSGYYTFENGGGVSRNQIAVQSASMDTKLKQRVDEILDDGNLSSGHVQSAPAGLVYILGE